MTSRPSREQFAALYKNNSMTLEEIAGLYRVNRATIKSWARRFNFSPRPSGGVRSSGPAPRIVLKDDENHCNPVNDGPLPGELTPEQITELAAYVRARNLLAMQTLEDEHCEHRRTGRCYKCRRMQKA